MKQYQFLEQLKQVFQSCRGQDKREENDSEIEDQKQLSPTQNQNDDEYIQSNNTLNNSEKKESKNVDFQENEKVKQSQSSSSKNLNQQNQLFNQNQSENNNFQSELYTQQISKQQQPQPFTPQKQSSIFQSESHQNQKNQNFDIWGNQKNNQQSSQIRYQQGTKRISPIKSIQPSQISQNQNYQEQVVNQQQFDFQQSYISIQQFNQKPINNSQPVYQDKFNMQMHWNQNYIDQERNNQSYNSQLFNQHNQQPTYNIKNNFNEGSQLKKNNQSFHSFNSSQVLTEYESCQIGQQSKSQTQQVKCYYCKKEINIQYFLLKCQHFYCNDCLKEFLKNQSKQINCYVFKCICSSEIKLQLLFSQKDRVAEILKEKMIINQINALRVNIQQKYQLKNCNNKCCLFFVIIQENLDQKYFYCPQCLEKQSNDQFNK